MGVAGIVADLAKTDNARVLANNVKAGAGTTTKAAVRVSDVDTYYSVPSTHHKQSWLLCSSCRGLGVSTDNASTMEYPGPHQAVVPSSKTRVPKTTRELSQLSVPAWHEVPLYPLPFASVTDPADPHHGVFASDDQLHTLP